MTKSLIKKNLELNLKFGRKSVEILKATKGRFYQRKRRWAECNENQLKIYFMPNVKWK